jgi:hypothetical protein
MRSLGYHVKALIFQGLKEPEQPASVHDVESADFLDSAQSIWKYRDGAVFRLEIDSETQGYKLLKVIKPTSFSCLHDHGVEIGLVP